MRISDWSSDVCSSDLHPQVRVYNIMIPGDELIFLPLGGSGEIGMNVNLYGCRGKWLMVDLGLTFGDPTVPGIDLVLPDLAFIEEIGRASCRESVFRYE